MKIDLNKYKAFFFDFDGVIADTVDIKTEAFGSLFKKYGKDIQQKVTDYHRDNGGVSRYEKFKYYYKNLLNKEIDQKIMNKLNKDYSNLVAEKVIEAPYIKGIIPFLKKLNKENKVCFVISGTPQKEIQYILKHKKINSMFRDAAGSPKNKTENLRILLRKHRIDPMRAIFFGDAKSDYEAARDNRIEFVGLVNKKSKELKRLACKYEIEDFKKLKMCDMKEGS